MSKKNNFMYLVPGNWFELKNITADKTYPYDIESFKEEILNQVRDRADKLDFIEISFGKRYNKNEIEEINFHLEEKKFIKMVKMLLNEKRHPIITFHGTNPNAVESIFADGYIIPSIDKSTGVTKRHGSAYGTGIYSSVFFDKANYYTNPDKDKYVYILINLVFLGTAKLIAPNPTGLNMGNPVDGMYKEGSNTRIVFGLEQLVSADPNRVVPLAVMKISIA